jgi:hypothetical protein
VIVQIPDLVRSNKSVARERPERVKCVFSSMSCAFLLMSYAQTLQPPCDQKNGLGVFTKAELLLS